MMAKVNPSLEKYKMKTTQVQDSSYVFLLPNPPLPVVSQSAQNLYILFWKNKKVHRFGGVTQTFTMSGSTESYKTIKTPSQGYERSSKY